MWSPIPEEYQGIMLEETPVMHPEEQKAAWVAKEPEVIKGVYHYCYICNLYLGNLPQDQKTCKIYNREPTKYDERRGKFVISFCTWCYQVHCK